jgi:ribosomal protein S18 acetylase RimI-like enzyme
MTTTSPTANNEAKPGEMQEDKISITYATPDDVDALVALHYRCFTEKDHIALKFGKRFIVSTYKWFITSPLTFVLIAKRGKELVGFQSVSDRPYDVPMLLANWKAAFRGLLARPWLVFHPELLRRLKYFIVPPEKKTLPGRKVAQLAFIGVDPQVRGLGVGKLLINATIAACRSRGMDALITGVKKQNLRSLSMLESAGLVIAPELETKRFVYLKLILNAQGTPPYKLSKKELESGNYLQSVD